MWQGIPFLLANEHCLVQHVGLPASGGNSPSEPNVLRILRRDVILLTADDPPLPLALSVKKAVGVQRGHQEPARTENVLFADDRLVGDLIKNFNNMEYHMCHNPPETVSMVVVLEAENVPNLEKSQHGSWFLFPSPNLYHIALPQLPIYSLIITWPICLVNAQIKK